MRDALRSGTAFLLLSLVIWFPCLVLAQTIGSPYPQRAIRMIVPYGAGQGSDTAARRLAAQLSQQLQQAVKVENQAGAGGAIGTQAVLHSPPDGHTLLYGILSNVVLAPLLNPSAGFATSDLQLVGMVALDSMTLVTDPTKGGSDLAFLQTLARSSTGLKFGFMGVGSSGHFLSLTLQQLWQARFVEIPYRLPAQAMRDLATGEIDVLALTTATAVRVAAAGTAQPIALSESRRLPCLPQLRTFREQGLNIELSGWHGLFVPSGTPEPVVRRLHAELQRALAQPEITQALTASCLTPWPTTLEEAQRRVAQDVALWRTQIRQLASHAQP